MAANDPMKAAKGEGTTNPRHLEAFRPKTLKDVIGLGQAKTQLQALVDAFHDGMPLSSVLFYGAAGGGKTTLAEAFANDLKLPLFKTVGDDIKKPERLWRFCESMTPMLQKHGCVVAFIDEIHTLRRQSEMWLPLLEDRHLYHGLSGRAFLRREDGKVRLLKLSEERSVPSFFRIQDDISYYPGVIWIGATTDPDQCGAPVARRFPTKVMIPDYTVMEIEVVLRRAAKKMLLNVELPADCISDAVFPFLAQRSRKSPAEALNLLQNILPWGKRGRLTPDVVDAILDGLNIGDLGMRLEDRVALEYLEANGSSGTNTIQAVLASRGVSPRAYRLNVEPFLLREGLVRIGQKGREITDAGKELLARERGT